ncbi:MAG: ABC transporter ATP-binding protein [Pseudomonadota bacterium]
MTLALRLENITKAYPGVIANRDVSLSVAPGQIHALLGENGAGKSTLVKAIYGLVSPDAGQMWVAGERYTPRSPKEARARGVGMVFQHFSLFEALSVAENVALGMDDAPPRSALAEMIRTTSERYGLPLDPSAIVGDLSVGERQRVEIVRCLLQDPRVLIMDEPTSVLTPQEVWVLFETLRRLADEGVAILYISHKLEEIRALCDAATILRQGAVTGSCDPREVSAQSLAELMIGQSLPEAATRRATRGEVRLSLNHLSLPSDSAFGVSLKDISLNLHAGEIVGVAGVAGNGQGELLSALSGERTTLPGMLTLTGEDIGMLSPNRRRALGLCSAPEERLGHAAAPNMTLAENALLTGRTRNRLTWNGFVKPETTANFARAVIARFDVRTNSPHAAARSLSGGNLQKFVMGREILQKPKVLVVNQPTWGVDANAVAAIHGALRNLSDEGAAILVISQDLDELFALCDRLAVLANGALSDAAPPGTLSIEELGRLMGGTETATQEMADAAT